MDTNYLLENLEKKSNAIVGFVVLQSLYFADKLAGEEFTQKLHTINGLYSYLFIAHCLILIVAIVILYIIDQRFIKYLDKETKEIIFPHATMMIKICLMSIFGFIPIFIIAHHFLK